MGYPHISSRVFPPAMAGRKVRFLAFGLTLSILIFGFFINYHHHSYVWEQEGCAICTVVLHQSANISIAVTVLLKPVFLLFLFIVPEHAAALIWGFSSHEIRASPASSSDDYLITVPALISSALVVGTMPHSTSVRFRRVCITPSKKKDIAVWFKAARQFPLFHGFLEQSFGGPFDIDPKTGEYRAIKPEDC